MKRNRSPSKSTCLVLETLLSNPGADRYGYELMKTTGLKSGTLYPILIRLKDRGLLEAHWRSSTQLGRPPRHAYRLTDTGLAFALETLETNKPQTTKPTRKART